MSQDSDQSNRQQKGSASELFHNTSYLAHARKLNAEPGAWIATDDLMAAIVANSKQPIPQVVLDHLRHRLDRKAAKPRGRKQPDAIAVIREALIPIDYERYLQWLQQRHKSQGLKGWSYIRNATWWNGPPHERAARMTQARLMKHVGWRHVRNIVSETSS
jgi:hypothetical protein